MNEKVISFFPFFSVLRNVSSVAQVDYSVVENPTFTSSYMDVPLKVKKLSSTKIVFKFILASSVFYFIFIL